MRKETGHGDFEEGTKRLELQNLKLQMLCTIFSLSFLSCKGDITLTVYFPGCGWDQLKNGTCKHVNTRQWLGFFPQGQN